MTDHGPRARELAARLKTLPPTRATARASDDLATKLEEADAAKRTDGAKGGLRTNLAQFNLGESADTAQELVDADEAQRRPALPAATTPNVPSPARSAAPSALSRAPAARQEHVTLVTFNRDGSRELLTVGEYLRGYRDCDFAAALEREGFVWTPAGFVLPEPRGRSRVVSAPALRPLVSPGQVPSAEDAVPLAERNLAALADPEHQRRAAAWRETRDAEERWRRMGFETDEGRAARA